MPTGEAGAGRGQGDQGRTPTTGEDASGVSRAPRQYVRTGGGRVIHRASCFADRGELRAAANAYRTARSWEQTAHVLASYVPELLEDELPPGPGTAQTMPE
jgi:hypothetical protein